MAESPTLLFRDARTGRVFTSNANDPAHGAAATHTLVDQEGHRMDVPHAQIWGDFAPYRLFGIDLPEGVVLVRREDDGTETSFALEEYEAGEPTDPEARTPWRAGLRGFQRRTPRPAGE